MKRSNIFSIGVYRYIYNNIIHSSGQSLQYVITVIHGGLYVLETPKTCFHAVFDSFSTYSYILLPTSSLSCCLCTKRGSRIIS